VVGSPIDVYRTRGSVAGDPDQIIRPAPGAVIPE